MKNRVLGLALALGAGLSMIAGGVAMAAPGPGNINPDTSASLTIHKYAGTPTGQANDGAAVTVTDRDPLAGVEFTLYEVTGLDVHNPADWTKITALNTAVVGGTGLASSGDPATLTLGGYAVEEVSAKTTGTDGIAAWNPLDQGVYYVMETDSPANVAEHTLPFLVTVPLAHNTDNTWIYDVNVYPKNGLVDIEKEAIDAGSVGVGSNIQWKVANEVPVIQGGFDNYRLRDVLDSRLDYVADSSVVTLAGTALDAADFSVTDNSGTLLLTINPTGLTKLGNNKGEDLIWTFNTTVKTIGNGVIENDASVLANQPNGDWNEAPTSDKVSSNWGAIKINKFENGIDKKALSGAIFQVFATEDAANACKNAVVAAKGTLTAGCADAVSVTRDAAGAEIAAPGQNQFTTDADGTVIIPGLHVGVTNVPAKDTDSTERDYWLVEIVPPAGFVNANDVYPVTVTAGSVTDAVTQDVANAQEPPTKLPLTGGQTTMVMIVAAALLGSGAFFLMSRKKSVTE